MKKFLVIATLLFATHSYGDSITGSNSAYKWHDAPLTNGQVAVVKRDFRINDGLKPGHDIVASDTPRMFVEKVILNGRKAVRLFEVHSWPICPALPNPCAVFVGRIKHERNSSSFTTKEVYHGAALVTAAGQVYITNDFIVKLIWESEAFSINTTTYANYSKSLPALFTERGGEFYNTLVNDSDAGFSKMGDKAWIGETRITTDGPMSTLKKIAGIREERNKQNVTSAPRVITE